MSEIQTLMTHSEKSAIYPLPHTQAHRQSWLNRFTCFEFMAVFLQLFKFLCVSLVWWSVVVLFLFCMILDCLFGFIKHHMYCRMNNSPNLSHHIQNPESSEFREHLDVSFPQWTDQTFTHPASLSINISYLMEWGILHAFFFCPCLISASASALPLAHLLLCPQLCLTSALPLFLPHLCPYLWITSASASASALHQPQLCFCLSSASASHLLLPRLWLCLTSASYFAQPLPHLCFWLRLCLTPASRLPLPHLCFCLTSASPINRI